MALMALVPSSLSFAAAFAAALTATFPTLCGVLRVVRVGVFVQLEDSLLVAAPHDLRCHACSFSVNFGLCCLSKLLLRVQDIRQIINELLAGPSLNVVTAHTDASSERCIKV